MLLYIVQWPWDIFQLCLSWSVFWPVPMLYIQQSWYIWAGRWSENSDGTHWWVWLRWGVWGDPPEDPPWPQCSLYPLLITSLIGPHMYATKTDWVKAFLLKVFILALFYLSCRSGQSHRENSENLQATDWKPVLLNLHTPRPPSRTGAVAVVLINMIANWLPHNC